MKQSVLIFAALFFLADFANAQNWVNGGNNLNASGRLGTTSAQSVVFITNNTERGRVNTSGFWGFGTASPTERVHINSASGKSALRVQVNLTTKFLVHSGGGVSVGGSSAPPADGMYVSGDVGVGTNTPSAKLDVVGSTFSGTGINAAGYNFGLRAGSTGSGYGVYGYSDFVGTYGVGDSYGVSGSSNSGTGTYGNSYDGYGVRGNSSQSYGGYFTSTDGYALRASTVNGYYAAVFYGRVFSSDGFITSDKNLKTDIHDFGDAMNIISKLKPQNYLFKDDAKYASLHLPRGRHYGLLAQDLQEVLPNLVSEAPHELRTEKTLTAVKPALDGKPAPMVSEQKEKIETVNIKAVNYVELIPIMVKAMQELKAEKDKEIADLKDEINNLKSLITKNGSSSVVTSQQGYLKQNIPNPSNNNTVISYYTPDDAKNAQILVTDMKGNVLKAYNIVRGQGQVNIGGSELPAGTYNYTLYINLNKIDTKKMVIVK